MIATGSLSLSRGSDRACDAALAFLFDLHVNKDRTRFPPGYVPT
jgi:hypothetical protein